VANFPFFSVPLAWLASRLRRRALVVTWHEFWGDYWYQYLGWRAIAGRWIELAALRCSPHVITVSEMTRRRLVAAGYPNNRITLLPNGADVNALARHHEPRGRFDLICIGRLLPHKHVELAIGALARLRRTRPNATLAIVGDGPERRRLERQVMDLDLAGAVRFFGKLRVAEEVYALMKSSRVLVAPSEREGFGISVVEGWACGLPAVACAGAENAIPELIDEPYKGRVVAPSAESIAEGCSELLREPPGVERPRQAAAAYDWTQIALRLERVYREALSTSRCRQSEV
jgi:glycosyltransferase involved in cell wall biosynthesis